MLQTRVYVTTASLAIGRPMNGKPRFLAAGDQALVAELGDAISPETNRRVHNLVAAIERHEIAGVVDIIPAYRSLLVQYDAIQLSFVELHDKLSQIAEAIDEQPAQQPTAVHIPTFYGGQYGPDLEFVAEHAEMTPAEVVEFHSSTDYLVYMMGFTPGFPYLSGVSEKIATPRLETPKVKIPAGSVGIAESQTGIYPVESPGGWRLIGRTPLRLFNPDDEPPFLLAAGDYVRFVTLPNEEEYMRIRDLVESGKYQVTTEKMQ